MAPIMFGFGSFGDIVTAVQLVYELGKILSDSRGSAKEYRELIVGLDSLRSTLENVDRVVALQALNPLQRSTMNAIQEAVKRCLELLKEFIGRVKGYHTSLRRGGSGNRLWDAWQKIGWGIVKREEVVEFRKKLMAQEATINLMISLSNCNALERVERAANEQNVSLQTIHRSIQELPMMLGYHWEGGADAKRRPVSLIDMLGNHLLLPIELCETWEAFEGLLRVYFKTRPGREYIARGDYDLTNQENNKVIEREHWKTHIKPGMTLDMNVVLWLLVSKASDGRRCPGCKKFCSGDDVLTREETTCSFCRTSFRVSGFHNDTTENSADIETSAEDEDEDEASDIWGCKASRESNTAEHESRFVRRFHLVMRIRQTPVQRKGPSIGFGSGYLMCARSSRHRSYLGDLAATRWF